jgi:trk system potassium uptake protein TrkA
VARRVLVIGATKMSERLIQRLLEGERARGRGVIGMLKGMLKGKRLITFMDASRDEGKRFARAFQGIDVFFGDSSEEGLLEKAGIDKADLVVCATESQTYNILTAQLAKTLGAGKSVAITLNDRYLALGATLEVDALVSVKSVVAASVLELVRKAHIRTIHGFFEDDVEIVELVIGPNSPAAGKQLLELTLPKGTLVAFAIKGEQMVVPKGSTVLDHGDTVAFIVRKNAIPGLERAFGGTIGD